MRSLKQELTTAWLATAVFCTALLVTGWVIRKHLAALCLCALLSVLVVRCENDPFGSGCDGVER